MQAISAAELLNYWERNMNQTMLQRAVDLLYCASPEVNPEDLALLSLGERDSRLLLLREYLFGSRLKNIADCPACSERVEWENDVQDIRLQWPKPDTLPGEYFLEEEGYKIVHRLPNSNDLVDLEANIEETTLSTKLLSKLIISCQYEGNPVDFNNLPGKILESIDQRIELENPQAEILMSISCVHCGHIWDIRFDIISYLWSEINGWATGILQDVGTLAQAYGWSEQDILNLSPARRQIYLNMAYS